MLRRCKSWLGMITVSLALVACGGGGEDTPFVPNEAIQPFVGTWDAEVFTVTLNADTTIVFDVTEDGSFDLNIQPSGLYTATLVFGSIPLVEIGQLSVEGNFVTLRPNAPDTSPATSAFTFIRDDFLRLLGPTEFDFNLDGTPEAAEALIELQRR